MEKYRRAKTNIEMERSKYCETKIDEKIEKKRQNNKWRKDRKVVQIRYQNADDDMTMG
jgi:hypothetical protein